MAKETNPFSVLLDEAERLVIEDLGSRIDVAIDAFLQGQVIESRARRYFALLCVLATRALDTELTLDRFELGEAGRRALWDRARVITMGLAAGAHHCTGSSCEHGQRLLAFDDAMKDRYQERERPRSPAERLPVEPTPDRPAVVSVVGGDFPPGRN